VTDDRFGWTVYFYQHYWNICTQCHHITWTHHQNIISVTPDNRPRNTHHPAIPSSCSSRRHMGCSLLLCQVSLSKYMSNGSFIPAEWRPNISVRVLPAVESILYGANLSNILSKHTSPFFDVLAWLPYGIIHFGAPVVCSGVLFLFAPPGSLPVFARSFGYMSLTGVLIQLLFPCSPPCTPLFTFG
jgi:hypothetical protein